MRKAFTMLELVFMITIIGILVAIAMPFYEETQDDALAATEKATIGEARHSVLSFHGWKLLHMDQQYTLLTIKSPYDGTYQCKLYFLNTYPVTVTDKSTEDNQITDNNTSIGYHTKANEYKTLAPLMLDPPTIKDWNSTRVNENEEYLTGPATNKVDYSNAELTKGMYWIYDNRNGYFLLKGKKQ